MTSEINRLNGLLEDKDQELFGLRSKTTEYEEITFRQQEEIMSVRSVGLKDYDELKKKFENKEASLIEENRTYRLQIEDYSSRIEDYTQEMRTQRERIAQLEEAISMAGFEIERYRVQEAQLKDEIGDLRVRVRESESQRADAMAETIGLRR